MNPKLNSSISVVKISDHILEFFKSNTRTQVRIKVNDDSILEIVNSLDGTRTIEEIAKDHNVSVDTLIKLLNFLATKGILDSTEPKDDFDQYNRFRRVIHFFSEYASSHEDLVAMWRRIRSGTVLIIGIGAVGSWVACNLAQSGVCSLILMDKDIVDQTNLHRQFGFCENDIGKYKVDVLAERLAEFNPLIHIKKHREYLTENELYVFDNEKIDLIINCADKPSVDMTSMWVGEYAMKRNIPHIVGGGYNLHLSLIGQTVLPGQSACVRCFQKSLDEENRIDPEKVKKLAVKNRKIGSFSPMCSLIASMVGMESLKVLAGITPSNLNRRGEFDIYNMDIVYRTYERRDDCEWCGKNGVYFHT